MSILFSDKSVQTWVVDGRIHLLFPDKVQSDIAAFSVTTPDASGGWTYQVDEIEAGTYCLHYLTSRRDLDMPLRMPLLALSDSETQEDDTVVKKFAPITYAKFPEVNRDPVTGVIHLTYWTNVDSDDAFGEPYDDLTGAVSKNFTRALYYAEGLLQVVETTFGGEGNDALEEAVLKLLYIFSAPVQLYKPDMWNGSDSVEPVLDVHTASASNVFLQFTPENNVGDF